MVRSQLDLLLVAGAAHAAGQSLSALRLLEISTEEENELLPALLLKDPTASKQLLDVLTSLPATDYARGVPTADGGGPMNVLRLLQLGGEHASSLSLIDTMRDTARASEDGPELQRGVVRALRGIGCEHLCAEWLALPEHTAATDPASRSALDEARAEQAWRLGLWQPERVEAGSYSLTPAPGSEGFHRLMFNGLAAIEDGHAHAAQGALRRCATGLVAKLGLAGDEGGKGMLELTLQLRMCADATEVAHALELGGACPAALRVTASGGDAPQASGYVTRERTLVAPAHHPKAAPSMS